MDLVRIDILAAVNIVVVLVIFAIWLRSRSPSVKPSVSTGHTSSSVSTPVSGGKARLTVLVDNNPRRESLKTAWGLSVLIETPNGTILFDVGPDPGVLAYNAGVLGVDLSKVDIIVISHGHGDHYGGLPLLSELKPEALVYVPSGSQRLATYARKLGFKVVSVNDTVEVGPGIYVVGPLYGPPPEIALALKSKEGLILIVGCSHPGVDRIAGKAVKDIGEPLYLVLGGFHMAGVSLSTIKAKMDKLLEVGARNIYPIHCSGEGVRSYLAQHHPQVYGDGGVGLQLALPID